MDDDGKVLEVVELQVVHDDTAMSPQGLWSLPAVAKYPSPRCVDALRQLGMQGDLCIQLRHRLGVVMARLGPSDEQRVSPIVLVATGGDPSRLEGIALYELRDAKARRIGSLGRCTMLDLSRRPMVDKRWTDVVTDDLRVLLSVPDLGPGMGMVFVTDPDGDMPEGSGIPDRVVVASQLDEKCVGRSSALLPRGQLRVAADVGDIGGVVFLARALHGLDEGVSAHDVQQAMDHAMELGELDGACARACGGDSAALGELAGILADGKEARAALEADPTALAQAVQERGGWLQGRTLGLSALRPDGIQAFLQSYARDRAHEVPTGRGVR